MSAMDAAIAHSLLSFALVAGLITVIPGLDTALVLRSALTLGRRHAFATASGILTGALVWGAAAATGVSVLLTASHAAYLALRVAGAAYLVWLGFSMLRSARRGGSAAESGAEADPVDAGTAGAGGVAGVRRAFLRGMATNLLNPKVGAFYVAMLPQFIPAHTSHLAMGLALATIHDVEGLLWFTVIILAAHRARGWFGRARVRRGLDAVTGTVLIGFGVELAARS
jgi:threonine/homoserine/homoserine lactone efflux protein